MLLGIPYQERLAISGSTRKSLAHTVRRALILRLALAGVVLALILSAVTFQTQRREIAESVMDRAQIAVEMIHVVLRESFDGEGLPDRATLERALEVRDREARKHWSGHYPVVRVYDLSGVLLAERSDPADAAEATAREILDERGPLAGPQPEVQQLVVRRDGRPYLHLSFPIYDRDGNYSAEIAGVFAVSDAAMASVQRRALKTAAYVCGIVLICAVIFFPLVSSLLGRVSHLTDNLLDAQLETLKITGSAIAKRDSDTDAHNYRVTILSVRLGEAMGLRNGEMQGLIKGAFLHDVGKIGIRDKILLKPGRLDQDEFAVMKTHVEHGLDIVSRSSWLEDAARVVGSHHEKYDGSGYPAGLAGENIPIVARIFAVADVFDALTSERPYKKPFSLEQTLEILEEGRGTHFDPEVLDVFQEMAREIYVELSSMDDIALREGLSEINQQFFVREMSSLV